MAFLSGAWNGFNSTSISFLYLSYYSQSEFSSNRRLFGQELTLLHNTLPEINFHDYFQQLKYGADRLAWFPIDGSFFTTSNWHSETYENTVFVHALYFYSQLVLNPFFGSLWYYRTWSWSSCVVSDRWFVFLHDFQLAQRDIRKYSLQECSLFLFTASAWSILWIIVVLPDIPACWRQKIWNGAETFIEHLRYILDCHWLSMTTAFCLNCCSQSRRGLNETDSALNDEV